MKNYLITYEKPTKYGYKECKRYTNNARKAFKRVFVYNIKIYLNEINCKTGNIEPKLLYKDKTTYKGEIENGKFNEFRT